MRFACLTVGLIALALSSAGCVALVDGALAGRTGVDAGVDDTGTPEDTGVETDTGPPVGACTGMPDGLRCAPDGIVEPFVCVDGVCVLSTCGDGVPDDRDGSMHDPEICDDGNSIPGDGCEVDCTFSCNIDSDCSDGELCTGEENCQSATHACEAGTAAVDGTTCMVDGIAAACRDGMCRAGACPDGTVDAGEDCDPGAPVAGDGCEDDCTFTCVADLDCADTDVCNGDEICNVDTHVCSPAAAALDCNDADPCTTDSCGTVGCVNTSMLVDGDSDGHFAITGSCGGDDCDDANPLRHPGAVEACGATLDLNCDGSVGTTPTWYRDCDGDDYAASTTGSTMACTEPAVATGCSGGWTSRAPVTGAIDCLDTSVGSSVRPGQTGWFSTNVTGLTPSYDYNCSGTQQREVDVFAPASVRPPVSTACTLTTRGCTGEVWWVASALPACGATTAQLNQCVYVPETLFPRADARCEREASAVPVRCH